jgi:hydroxymethylpyrimidine/phosphomethylpyrimidine kinase
MKGRVLIVAGSDSGGGAGIQADIKAVTALGAFAMTAVTALTAQDTKGVHGVFPVPDDFIRRQMDVVLADLGADAIKTGMLATEGVIDAVAGVLAAAAPGVPLVVDPVMVAKGGARLLEESAIAAVRQRLLPLAALATPNLPEAAALLGRRIAGAGDFAAAARAIQALGAKAVLMKGGHLEGPRVIDVLVTADGAVHRFEDARIESRNTHGTGCTLASAVAAGLAQGMALVEAVSRARAYVRAAILAAPGFGAGHGPLDHGVTVDAAKVAALGRQGR